MPKSSPIQTAFNRGEFSPLMGGQITLQSRAGAVALMQNLIGLKQGPAMRRGGTKYVSPIKDSSKRTAIIPFRFSTVQDYIIELGDQYFRFYRNNAEITLSAQNISAITKANPAVITYAGADTYANGDTVYVSGVVGMVEMNGRFIKVANVNAGANTFEANELDGTAINSTAYTTYTSGGTIAEIYEIASPYTQANIFDSNNLLNLQYAQSADVLYIVQGSYAPRALSRTGHTAWTLTTLNFNDGPYLDVNTTTTKLTLSANTGSVTVTASSAIFTVTTDIGRLIRWKDHAGNWTWLKITATASTTSVTATIMGSDAATVVGTITGATQANPCVVTATGHGYSNGDIVYISGVVGMTQLNGNFYTVANKAANTFQLSGIDSSAYTAYVSGGTAVPATINWRLGAYSDTTGWPRAISFHQNRLVVGGSSTYPDRFDMTITGGYSGTDLYFQPGNAAGVTADDDAISDTLQSGQVNAIQWMMSGTAGLVIGTASQEFLISSSTQNLILTPTNAKSDPISGRGSAYIQPIYGDNGALFAQRARRRVHDIVYSIEQNAEKPRDLTVAADHITRTQLVGMAYQAEPVNVVWAYRADGLLIGQTYYPDENVFGWHRHPVGGYSNSGKTLGAIVESIAVIPSSDGSRDELWLVVNRYINGGTKRYVEYMTRYYEDDIAQEDAFHVDCGATYDGTATATVHGLWHLNGQTVKIMLDGKSHPDLTVANGAITLANSRTGSTIQIGLSCPWALWSLPLEAGAADGTAQGKTKRITGFVARLLNTLGLTYGASSTAITDDYDFGQTVAYDTVTPLFSGDTDFLPWPEGYEQAGQMYLTHDGVFPACILSLMPQEDTQDR